MTRIFPILFALVIAPTAVFAQGEPEPIDPNVGECETDMDCGPNELCETFEWEACPGYLR